MVSKVSPVIADLSHSADKDPDSVLDYSISYEAELAALTPPDSVSSSSWTITNSNQTLSSPTFTAAGLCTIWVSSGGKLGSIERLTNHIVTAAGREYDSTIVITFQRK